MRSLVIAEIGVNHNGSIDLAKKLIDVAAESGADVAKFQTFNAKSLVTRNAEKASYQIKNTCTNESQYEMLSKLELTKEMHYELASHCNLRGIHFLSTGFDIQSVVFLNSMGSGYIKIPSGEITNLPYLRCIGKFNKKVILSTGMSTLGEIEDAIEVIESNGTDRAKITVLHCTSDYPASIDQINLLAMLTIKDALKVKIGYSDHSSGIEVSLAAAALGACVIEKHLTLDREMPGPDHRASLEPAEFKLMVNGIRNIEKAMGDGVKRLMPSEQKIKLVARKSIVAKRNILAGEKFTEENIDVKRPGTGISPMLWDYVIGKIAKNNFSVDELICL